NVALNALLFLYRYVLHQPWPELGPIAHAKRPRRLPTVLTQEEVTAVLARLHGTSLLMASLSTYARGTCLLAAGVCCLSPRTRRAPRAEPPRPPSCWLPAKLLSRWRSGEAGGCAYAAQRGYARGGYSKIAL